MANDTLVQAIKALVALAKDGDMDGVYRGYRDLFAAAEFNQYRVDDQRQALRLMIMMKGAPTTPTPAMIEAHRDYPVPKTMSLPEAESLLLRMVRASP